MKWKDQFQFVRQNMKKNKTRVFMTILATAMGCAFLIVLASVGFGLHKSMLKEMMEQRIVTGIDVHGKKREDQSFQAITDEDIDYFESIEDVKAVTRRKNLQQAGMYKLNDYEGSASTIVAHIPSEIKAGFELSKGRLPQKDHEVIVGYDFEGVLASKAADEANIYDESGNIKEEYRYKGKLLGQKLQLTVRQYEKGKEVKKNMALTIVGVGKKPTKQWMQDTNVYISEAVLKKIEAFTGTPRGAERDPNSGQVLGNIDSKSYDQVVVYAKSVDAVKGINEKLKGKKYMTYSVMDELKQVNMFFTIVKIGLILIGTIAILIASIGIYNTMTMAVTERAPDIGIMKAIGANPATVKRIFLLESSYIGMIGAIVGTVVSYAISYGVNFALPLIIEAAFQEQVPDELKFSHIPLSLPLICIIICYIVTILSGLRPAKRATKVDVLRALRREV
jgi:acetoin utilization transport system permease protein